MNNIRNKTLLVTLILTAFSTKVSFGASQTDLMNITQKQRLPKGIKIKLTVKDVEYEWIFSLLNTDYLQPKDNN